MGSLTLAGRPILSVFRLLGTSENDMTKAFGFALDRSPSLIRRFMEELGYVDRREWIVRLQTSGTDRGYTDIEVEAPGTPSPSSRQSVGGSSLRRPS